MDDEEENFDQLIRKEGIVPFGEKETSRRPSAVRPSELPDPATDCSEVTGVLLPEDRPDLECYADSWHAAGLERDMKKAVKEDRAEASCDLHGLSIVKAWRQTKDFLLEARRQDRRILEIVHGYGRTRNSPSKIRFKVRGWLVESDEVNWFCQRRRNKGATLLGLRSRRSRR